MKTKRSLNADHDLSITIQELTDHHLPIKSSLKLKNDSDNMNMKNGDWKQCIKRGWAAWKKDCGLVTPGSKSDGKINTPGPKGVEKSRGELGS